MSQKKTFINAQYWYILGHKQISITTTTIPPPDCSHHSAKFVLTDCHSSFMHMCLRLTCEFSCACKLYFVYVADRLSKSFTYRRRVYKWKVLHLYIRRNKNCRPPDASNHAIIRHTQHKKKTLCKALRCFLYIY